MKKIILFLTISLSLSNCTFEGSINPNKLTEKEPTQKVNEDKVNTADVSKVQIVSTDNMVVPEGGKIQISANVIYVDNTRDSAIEWSSSDNTILTVNSTTGDISGVKPGIATIIATSLKDSSKKDSVTVTVKKADVVEALAKITPKEASLKIGETVQIEASIQLSDGKISPNVIWKSANSSIALVTNGLVTAVGAGTTTVTAIASGDSSKTASANIKVTTEETTSEKK